jgi:Fic family protein
MNSFRDLDRHLGMIPQALLRQLTEVENAKGQQEVFRRQHPQALEALVEIARVQSVEASNAIENITAPPQRIKELVAEKTTPQNRSEAEIAGYRAVLELIHSSADAIPFTPSVVEQLHRDLYQFTGNRNAGAWKKFNNTVEETLPDGTHQVRFEPVEAWATPEAMNELHRRFNEAADQDAYHLLLLAGAYILDFLVIHPFSDGNGRMSRLLTLLLLYRGDYEVGRFISLEKLINDSKETYYEALGASTVGWHEGTHTLGPWLSYFLGIVKRAYDLFEERVGAISAGKGAKADAVRRFVRSRISDTFKFDELRQAVPGASDVYLRETLRKMRDEGIIRQEGEGRGSFWRRLRTDF